MANSSKVGKKMREFGKKLPSISGYRAKKAAKEAVKQSIERYQRNIKQIDKFRSEKKTIEEQITELKNKKYQDEQLERMNKRMIEALEREKLQLTGMIQAEKEDKLNMLVKIRLGEKKIRELEES